MALRQTAPEFQVDMRILITGGAGFIGSHVAATLIDRGHDLAVVDDLSGGYKRNIPPAATFYEEDITEPVESVADFQPETIIHCAAYAAEGLSHWMRRYNYTQNLIGWANIANAAVETGVSKVVALSSMAVYGSQEPPFTEDMVPQPEDPYGAAKTALEADIKALSAVQGVDSLIIRPHNVYGPGQNLADPYRNVVAIFLRQALKGEPITVFGDGRQTRAFSYIGDVAEAVADLTLHRCGAIVNVGGENPVTILELAHLVKKLTGSVSPIVHLPPRHEVEDAWCDHTKLRDLLGSWWPTDLETGLAKMVDWAYGLQLGPKRQYEYETTRNMFEAWK